MQVKVYNLCLKLLDEPDIGHIHFAHNNPIYWMTQ